MKRLERLVLKELDNVIILETIFDGKIPLYIKGIRNGKVFELGEWVKDDKSFTGD